jgi:tetratricopeptide (TPR) repeat protein
MATFPFPGSSDHRVKVALIVVAICVGTAPLARGTWHQAQPDLASLLDAYHSGHYDDAVARASRVPDLGPLRLQFVQQTPGWIASDPARAEARRAAVAGFIVELAAARLEDDWGRLSDLIEWTCAQILRASGPPTEFERKWHLATTALAGRARTRLWLLGPYARLPHQKPLKRAPQKDDPPSPLHLMHAIERFPDDPQFQLARVVAWTWGRDSEPIRNMRPEWRANAARWAPSRPPQLEAVTALEPLTRVAEVAAEAWIRTGMIYVTVADHAAALRAFETAQPIARTTPLKYLSHFLAARSLESLQRPEEAMTQYRRALEIVPAAESATVALAALQFVSGDTESSIAMIDAVFGKTGTGTDPGRMAGYGFYLHWPEIKAAMRAELK